MAEDAVIRIEVKLTASSGAEIKNLIAEAKAAKREEQEDRANLSAQRKAQGKEKEVRRDYGIISKTVKKEAKNAEKAAGAEDELIDSLLNQFSKEAEGEAIQDVISSIPAPGNKLGQSADLLDDIDSKGIQNLKGFAKNPGGMVQNRLLMILGRAGPYGAVAAALIAVIIGAPELVKAIVEMFAVKGGPLNLDFRYSQEEQMGQEFDRIDQFKRITGDNPFIRVDTHGYVSGDPDFGGNSLVDNEITRTARISIAQKSLSFTTGI